MYISLNHVLLYIIFLNLYGLKVLISNLNIETCIKTRYSKSCQIWICALTFNVLSFFICCLKIKLIVICNMSLRNPGPNNNRPLSVLYNNVQGLINAGDLASETPPINMIKLHELHGYLYIHKPDVLILNETWLKKFILDTEILPSSYNIIRLDRSIKTHPWDPDHPKKFRKNGGGVLVAHRNDINISSCKINCVTSQAELLSIILKLPSNKKLCISTVYRVGTLGINNFNEIKKSFSIEEETRQTHTHR